jgi:phosphoribosylformylglycinamidine cyclo-ligase
VNTLKDSRSYSDLGVSSAKEDIIAAAKIQKEGIFSKTFCKVIEDVFTGNSNYCTSFHSDGAGTKSIVAYLLYKELKDSSVFKSLAQDALVMNIDDLLCIGATGPFMATNTIGRNKNLIPAECIETIIHGYEECAQTLSSFDIPVHLCGGETADLGDLVRTLIVDASVATRIERSKVIKCNIRPGDVIVGLSSTGKSTYEKEQNSGIGSNGLTLARHILLKKSNRINYPESLDPALPKEIAYRGIYSITDSPRILNSTMLGKALLSPTRTYAPVIAQLLKEIPRDKIYGIIHCTGGGQTKCTNFANNIKFVKDSLFKVPPIFKLIQIIGNIPWKEMYQIFNMGHRMEIFVKSNIAKKIISIANNFNIDAQVIGHCEQKLEKDSELVIKGPAGIITYS